MAPVDRGGQGLLAGDGAPRAPDEQPEPVVEAGLDLLGGEGPEPGGGQLEGERDAVEAGAHGPHRRLAGGVQGEPRADRARPFHEQSHGVVGGQGRHLPDGLPRQAEWLAAGCQHRHLRAGPQQGGRDLGRPLPHVLAVVQADQGAAVRQGHRHRPQRATDGLHQHPGGRGDDLGDVGGLGDRPQLDPPDAVRPPPGLVGDDLRGQARLAHAADAGQGHQPPVREDPADARALGLTPDEPGELDREVVRDPGPGVAVRRLGSG